MNDSNTISIQPIEAPWLSGKSIVLHVLRLDELHPVVSGNKWFKLKFYLDDALAKRKNTIATFGGAFSNHIVATAFACSEKKIKCIGIIRGEEPKQLSHTLLQAKSYGMKLQFVSREMYKNKIALQTMPTDAYWINEGGYGTLGAKGASSITNCVTNFETYTHIVCATGTGTTLSGLIEKALPHQKVIGITALKNNKSIEDEIRQLIPANKWEQAVTICYDYHFGGYAKYTASLLQFMNEVWHQHQLPLDFVYTAKAFFGVQDLITEKQSISPGSRILFIHTGGLQGNLSLPKQVLAFS